MTASLESIKVYSTSNKRRFPRAKFWRRVNNIMLELDVWSSGYESSLEDVDSVMLRNKIRERIMLIDQLWHLLNDVREYLERSW